MYKLQIIHEHCVHERAYEISETPIKIASYLIINMNIKIFGEK